MVIKALEDGRTPVVLGGDHSVAAGTVSGVAEFYRRQDKKIGLIWMDAHADINTPETSPSGNVHGMPLAALLGLGPQMLADIYGYSPKVDPTNTVLLGVRDIDPAERENIKSAGITAVYTMRDIDERGMRTVMEEALRVASHGTAGLSHFTRYGLDRPRGRARRGHSRSGWLDLSRSASCDGNTCRPRAACSASKSLRSTR